MTFTRDRYQSIIRALRFDDFKNRDKEKKDAPISEVGKISEKHKFLAFFRSYRKISNFIRTFGKFVYR